MAGEGKHFIDSVLQEKLQTAVSQFCKSDLTPEQFLAKLKEQLPVHKTDRDTWKARVEGFSTVSDLLIEQIVAKAAQSEDAPKNREQVVRQARLHPLSYYHYVTGSREPAENVRTSEDYFNDPTTALVKLEDDIIALAKLYRKYGTAK